MAFFLPSAIIILIIRKKFIEIPFAIVFAVIPNIISNSLLYYIKSVSILNNNSEIYTVIINSYLGIFRNITNLQWLWAWIRYIFIEQNILKIFISVFFMSNFYFLPLLFLFIYIYARTKSSFKLNNVEYSILLTALIIFLFNNLAPKYNGWQMRGEWIARLYQPIFIVFILYISRFLSLGISKSINKKLLIGLYVFAVVLNASIVFGPCY